VSQGRLDGLRDQVVAGTEVPVEAAMGKTCFGHQVGDSHALDSVAADPGGRSLDDPLVASGFICSRAAHVSGLLTWSCRVCP
jgi:hypothetical protein